MILTLGNFDITYEFQIEKWFFPKNKFVFENSIWDINFLFLSLKKCHVTNSSICKNWIPQRKKKNPKKACFTGKPVLLRKNLKRHYIRGNRQFFNLKFVFDWKLTHNTHKCGPRPPLPYIIQTAIKICKILPAL